MSFSHLRFRKQLTQEKPRSRHASGDRIQKSEKETWPLLPRPSALNILQDHIAGSRENTYIETEREDGEPV